MKEKSPVFEENYQYYLDRLRKCDLVPRADILGVEIDAGGLVIPFFGLPHRVSTDGIIGPGGLRPSYSVCIVLFKYVLLCPDQVPVKGDWASFRDFKDSGPLVVFFATEVEAFLARNFQGEILRLESAAKWLGGRVLKRAFSHDLSVQFDPLPRLSMLMLFNDRDEEFPAQCSVLFERRTEVYLDMESVAILGHELSRTLVQFKLR